MPPPPGREEEEEEEEQLIHEFTGAPGQALLSSSTQVQLEFV